MKGFARFILGALLALLQWQQLSGQTPGDDSPKELLTLEINRSFFIPGEELLAAINVATDRAFHISKVAYVELIDPDNRPVIQQKIAIQKGKGTVQLYLPSNLKTGVYTLQAHTRWMRNFGAHSFAQRKINMINPFIALPRELTHHEEGEALRFEIAPEGGFYFTGERQLMAFKVVNQHGELIRAAIQVKDDASNTLFDRDYSEGYGHFYMTPGQAERFYVVMTDASDQLHFDEFEISPRERVAAIREYETTIELEMISQLEECKVEIWHRGMLSLSRKVDSIKQQFPKTQLPKGLLLMKLIDEEGNTQLRQCIFNVPDQQQVRISLAARKYAPGDPIRFSLASDQEMEVHVVVRKKQRIPRSETLASNHFFGPVNSQLIQKWPDDRLSKEVLPLLEKELTWGGISVDTMFYPDLRGELVTGKLYGPNGVAANHPFFVTIGGINLKMIPVSTNDIGEFQFSISPEFSDRRILFSQIGNYTVTLASPFPATCDHIEKEELAITQQDLEQWLIRKSQEVQIKNLYELQSVRTPKNSEAVSALSFTYTKSVFSYYLDDFTRFPTLEDHIIEYIPMVTIKEGNGETEFQLRNVANRSATYREVLTTYNGMVCTPEKVLSFSPLTVQKIEVIASQFQLGDRVYAGAVNFLTYPNQADEVALCEGCINQPYQQIEKVRNYPTEKPSGLGKIPDMRVQLLWQPFMVLNRDTQLTCTASDITGKYEVVVTGVSTTNYVHDRIEFEIVDESELD